MARRATVGPRQGRSLAVAALAALLAAALVTTGLPGAVPPAGAQEDPPSCGIDVRFDGDTVSYAMDMRLCDGYEPELPTYLLVTEPEADPFDLDPSQVFHETATAGPVVGFSHTTVGMPERWWVFVTQFHEFPVYQVEVELPAGPDPEPELSVSATVTPDPSGGPLDWILDGSPSAGVEHFHWTVAGANGQPIAELEGEQVAFTFPAPGTFEVTLSGCALVGGVITCQIWTTTIHIAVAPAFEVASAGDDAGPWAATLDASATQGEVAAHHWSVDGVAVATSTEATYIHDFGAPGRYEVLLTVEDPSGGLHSVGRTVSIPLLEIAVDAGQGHGLLTGKVDDPSGACDAGNRLRVDSHLQLWAGVTLTSDATMAAPAVWESATIEDFGLLAPQSSASATLFCYSQPGQLVRVAYDVTDRTALLLTQLQFLFVMLGGELGPENAPRLVEAWDALRGETHHLQRAVALLGDGLLGDATALEDAAHHLLLALLSEREREALLELALAAGTTLPAVGVVIALLELAADSLVTLQVEFAHALQVLSQGGIGALHEYYERRVDDLAGTLEALEQQERELLERLEDIEAQLERLAGESSDLEQELAAINVQCRGPGGCPEELRQRRRDIRQRFAGIQRETGQLRGQRPVTRALLDRVRTDVTTTRGLLQTARAIAIVADAILRVVRFVRDYAAVLELAGAGHGTGHVDFRSRRPAP